MTPAEETESCIYDQKPIYDPTLRSCPGDVEIPNRVFVKGFPREATADDLFTFFEEYGQVLECRIVADRNGYSKGMKVYIFFGGIFTTGSECQQILDVIFSFTSS